MGGDAGLHRYPGSRLTSLLHPLLLQARSIRAPEGALIPKQGSHRLRQISPAADATMWPSRRTATDSVG